MNDRHNIKSGAIAAVLAALCCAAPLLIVALGTAGLTAWLAKSAYVLIPALLIGLGLVSLWFYRRSAAAQACCDPAASPKQGIKL
jgi:mercuric ion transport protein